jgi:hypothetical protein
MATNTVHENVRDITSVVLPFQMSLKGKEDRFLVRGTDVTFISERKYERNINSRQYEQIIQQNVACSASSILRRIWLNFLAQYFIFDSFTVFTFFFWISNFFGLSTTEET